jgi:glycosyl hydrolase family 2
VTADSISLNGIWELAAGQAPDWNAAVPIRVPGLWEAQGHLELDGVVWYRRRFELADAGGHWTLRFGAVMDEAEVWLNGTLLGGNDLAFTPFELDATAALVTGANELAVRVTDPPVDSPGHLTGAHGKQGWANHVFPSPPSLYMTYGGIWQPVTLRGHGPLVITDVFVDADSERLTVTVEVDARGPDPVTDQIVTVHTLGRAVTSAFAVAPGGREAVRLELGEVDAPRWSPERPVLHQVTVEANAGGQVSDACVVRYGLRTVRLDGARLLLDGEPYRMRSALVQGFWPGGLYAEDGREAVQAEVRAAKAMGLNTLRLHIKAFDPVYLDVCDELGMLLHCDIPVAEPVDHDQLGADTPLAHRCAAAATAQVRRDRNHPSVILWSAMNELCLERMEARGTDAYEAFARTLVAAVTDADPTRPVIENDWIDPDPERVFATAVLTAHWYGRLTSDWLDRLDADAARWAGTGRPLFVTEFGDWGLPDMPARDDSPFWWQGPYYAEALAGTPWPATLAAFTAGTQRYQGLADRLQAEVLRRHDHVGGWCVTELTDVPYELNGLLDLERRPKPAAVDEMRRLNQPVLPMLALGGFAVRAGGEVRAVLHVANDGPALAGVRVEAMLGERTVVLAAGVDLPAHKATALGEVTVPAPSRSGPCELRLRLSAAGRGPAAENRYPLTVVAAPAGDGPAVELVGTGPTFEALAAAGATLGQGAGLLVVAEGALDAEAGRAAGARLATGGTVVVLAQEPSAAGHYPLPAELLPVDAGWGSSVFNFTTDEAVLRALPRCAVLATEMATVFPSSWLTRLGAGVGGWPATVVVGAFKPVPDALGGTVVGALPVGSGWLAACQLRLAAPAAAGDPAAVGILADLLGWAARRQRGAGAPAGYEASHRRCSRRRSGR